MKSVINLAIAEDEESTRSQLKNYVLQYAKEKDVPVQITLFEDGLKLLSGYQAGFDILLLDIEMPYCNGMEAAKRIRKIDSSVIIIFVTNMAQYALEGYSVDALDFIVKPVNYFDITYRLDKARKMLERQKKDKIVLHSNRQILYIEVKEILYVEVKRNHVVYHTQESNIEVHDTLRHVEETLNKYGFAKCNSGTLVNPQYIRAIEGNSVLVGEERLPLSRYRKADFLNQITEWGKWL